MTGSSISHTDAYATAATGDLWLFRGRSTADRTIQTLTNSPVNHVGMVVALDGLPPLIWHAEMGRSLPDVWTGTHQRGVQLHRLKDAVEVWENKYGQRTWMRQLVGAISSGQEDQLVKTIAQYSGRPFPKSAGVLGRWLAYRVSRREHTLETIYCAELVATTFKAMGILPQDRPASWYDPGRFSSTDELELKPPYGLTGEIAVLN